MDKHPNTIQQSTTRTNILKHMIKKPLTPANTEDVQYSLKKLMILSQLFTFEFQMYLVDTKFRSPQMNQFASRVGKDTAEIKRLLSGSVKMLETEYAEEYTGMLWRIMDKLCEMDLDEVTEMAEYLENKNAVLA